MCNACLETDLDAEDVTLTAQAIVNGAPTNWQSWRGVVGVIPQFGNSALPLSLCTGTLIQPDVVLTAGHCVFNVGATALETYDFRDKPEKVLIKGGANLSMGLGGIPIGVAKSVLAHPTWNGVLEEGAVDLALIRLRQPVTDLPWYCLRRNSMATVGEPGVVVGYGITSMAAQLSNGVHRSGETTVLQVIDHLIEVGSPSSTCQGDSGGPLFTREEEEHVLTGVTSFGTKSICSADDDSWEVNLFSYLDWIDQEVELLTGAPMNNDCTGTGPVSDLDADKTDDELENDAVIEGDARDAGNDTDAPARDAGDNVSQDVSSSAGGTGCQLQPSRPDHSLFIRVFEAL